MVPELDRELWMLALVQADPATCAVAECVSKTMRMGLQEWSIVLRNETNKHIDSPFNVLDPEMLVQHITHVKDVDWPTARILATKRYALQFSERIQCRPTDADATFLMSALYALLQEDVYSFVRHMTEKPHVLIRTYDASSSSKNYLCLEGPFLVLEDTPHHRQMLSTWAMHSDDARLCWLGNNTDPVKSVGFIELLLTLHNKGSELPLDRKDDTKRQRLIRGCIAVMGAVYE